MPSTTAASVPAVSAAWTKRTVFFGPADECLPPQCVDPPRRFAKQLMQLVRVRLYMFLVAAISALFFVVTGIQFWVTNYLALPPSQGGLGFPLKDVVIAFALVSATGGSREVTIWSADFPSY